ncbi:MAG: class I SAM-dependent methyltransferase [Ignavibacteria bacterium]|nr:class I SAM-dependent methyltransferase [Ignavibacteria bacterium]
MYNQLAKYYDKIYQWKDYKTECEKIHALIKRYKKTSGKEMLDVACGTGNHIQYLNKYYNITGLDLDKDMLKIAKEKFPGVKFHSGDMRNFDLGKKYDVIVCLFAAIAHLLTKTDLKKAIKKLTEHLKEGGVMILEGFVEPDSFIPGLVHAVTVNEPDLKICRMNITKRKNNIAIVKFHVLVADPNGVEYITEDHKLAMYEHKDFLYAMKREGLTSMYLKKGLMKNRGLYIGVKDFTIK